MGKFNLSVLLVEDDRLSLFVYAEFIKNIVTEVYSAANGREGIKVFKKNKPDIIITDIMMPEMDGLEMIREIKKLDPNVKVIMISGHSEADYFIRSIDLGVDGYLLKPVDNTRLENKITELGKNILLSQKVENMMEELKTLNLELEEKVKDRTLLLSNEIKEKENAEKALIKAKEKAEESDKLKGAFLANVSHEIQTPIKAIISFSNLLHSHTQNDKRRKELINIIDSNSNALLNLTNDILEFTRLQSKTVKLYNINFELNLFLEELFPVFESLRRKQSEKTIKLRFSASNKGESIMISSDPSRLRQVFTNLISNAFKFTHEGLVEYGYQIKDNKHVLFYVKDTGLGISREYQNKIFKRFVQEPKTLGIKKEGTGLGLPITQSLIGMLGGRIWVESALGMGSTFFFELPNTIIRPEDEDPDHASVWTDKQVLVVEDEIRDYISIEEILKNRVRIHYVDSPEQALEFCSVNKQMDLCLYRWHPGSSVEPIEKIRRMKPNHSIIALLDRGVKDKNKSILSKYFDATMIKPYKKEKILKILDAFLS